MLALERQRPGDVDHELIWACVGAAGLAALAALRFLPRAHRGPICPLKVMTGLPCPTCGGTRAALALASFDLHREIAMNPLVTLAAFAFGAYWIYALWAVVFRPARRLRVALPEPPLGTAIRGAALAAFIANWAYLIWVGR